METKDSQDVLYSWGKLNDLLEYLHSKSYTDVEKVKKAKEIAFDICIKYSKSFEEMRGQK